MKKTLVAVAVLLPFLFMLMACPGKQEKPDVVSSNNATPWMVPVEVADTPNATENDYYNFGWQTFIALNWPASLSYRGKPDSSLALGAKDATGNMYPAVWETWKEQYDIFLANAINPGPWNWMLQNNAAPVKVLRMFSKNDSNRVFDAFNQATGEPLIDQDSQFVRYEVRTNESEYTYYLNNKYYNADSQINAVANNRFVGFPKGNDSLSKSLPAWAQFGATEIKASWKVFKPNTPATILERYFHRSAILIDQYGNKGAPVEVGLVGLHILRLTPTTGSSWYWASFEQVDNLELQPQYGGTLPPSPTFNTNPVKLYGDSGYSYKPASITFGKPLPPAIPVGVCSPPFLQSNPQLDSINKLYTQSVKGTPFQYYQMIGTVNPPGKGGSSYTNVDSRNKYPSVTVNTSWLANSTMETYMIPSGVQLANNNCITCHISGYPQMPANTPTPYSGNYQIFTFLPRLAQSSSMKKVMPVDFVLVRGKK